MIVMRRITGAERSSFLIVFETVFPPIDISTRVLALDEDGVAERQYASWIFLSTASYQRVTCN